MTLTLLLDTMPAQVAGANHANAHGRKRRLAHGKERARQRAFAKLEAQNLIVERGLTTPVFPATAYVRIEVAWGKERTPRYPNGRYRQRHDPNGIGYAVKGLLDGLQDAGLIASDRDLELEYVQTQDRRPDVAWHGGYVLVTVAETREEA